MSMSVVRPIVRTATFIGFAIAAGSCGGGGTTFTVGDAAAESGDLMTLFPPDMAAAQDLSVPDLGASDLRASDLAVPDLASPADIAMTPADIAMTPADLRNGPDLAMMPPPQLEWIPAGSQGLGGPVIDASPDEAGNIWAVAPDALYIRRAGAGAFRRYTNADGLHIWSVITAVAGGAGDEGWVGLQGHETDYPEADPQDLKEAGKAEHVWLNGNDSIRTLHYANMHNDGDAAHWETRTAERLLYVHTGPAAGHLFMGGNHGIVHIFNDTWGDHVHVELYVEPENVMSFGLWFGLAVDPGSGDLWTCGKTACGLEAWNADPHQWAVAGHYIYAFSVWSNDHGLQEPSGYREDQVGTALTSDGTAWFLSKAYGLASWKPNGYHYEQVRAVPVAGLGLPIDVVADPDGTLWVADSSHLIRYNPQNNTTSTLGLPSGDLRRLYVDTRVNPRAVYVSTGGGLAIYRGK